jgi:hypothetical protein
MPAESKPPGQRRRRNIAAPHDVLPAEGCGLAAPRWPYAGAAPKLWRDLWNRPIAVVWHAQAIPPSVVARYVLAAIAFSGEPTAAMGSVLNGLETSLGLTPLALARLHLRVEPTPETKALDDPYADLRASMEADS